MEWIPYFRRAHAQSVEDGERVFIHLPQEEAGCGNAAVHVLSPRGEPTRRPPLIFSRKLYHKRGAAVNRLAPPFDFARTACYNVSEKGGAAWNGSLTAIRRSITRRIR